jgi:hypothetical protein
VAEDAQADRSDPCSPYSRWSTLDQVEKRHIVEQIAERITIGKDDVAIDLCYLPSSSEIMSKGQHRVTAAL